MAEKRDVIAQVRVPFCVSDGALQRDGMILGWDSARMNAYVDALVAEIEANAGQFDDCRVRAVHLGGGVASNAGAGVARIMRALRQTCEVADGAPVTMRSSIANVSGATMPFFRRAGVTRFDFEMLSLNPVDFVRLNRVDNLNDLPIICDHFLHAYANDTLGLVLAFGHAAPRARTARSTCGAPRLRRRARMRCMWSWCRWPTRRRLRPRRLRVSWTTCGTRSRSTVSPNTCRCASRAPGMRTPSPCAPPRARRKSASAWAPSRASTAQRA